jgi:hypothetical protein
MKLLSQRAAIHFETPGRYGSFEIIACPAGANSVKAALSRLQALDQIAADAIRCVRSQLSLSSWHGFPTMRR